MIQGIYELVLRAPDGRERRQLAIVPNEQVRQDYYDKASKNGLKIELRELNESRLDVKHQNEK